MNMFCKWCGADLPNAANKCARCGKEVPAMSDCGGFYDLVSDPKKRPVAAPVPAAPKVEPVSEGPAKAAVTKKNVPAKDKKNGRGNSLQLLITCIGFVVVIALLLVMNGRIGKTIADVASINGKVARVDKDLQQVTPALKEFLQITPSEPEEEEDPTLSTEETTEPNEVLLEEQDAVIEIVVDHFVAGASVKTTADLGDYEDAVVDLVKFGGSTLSPSYVKIDLTDAEDCIDIEIDNELPEYDYDEGSIDVYFEIDEEVFAEVQGDVEYEWKYRIAGASEWLPLDEDVFMVSDDGDNVSYTAIDLADLLEDAEMVELRVQYTRDNVSDGSLTITISGITVTYQSEKIENDINN